MNNLSCSLCDKQAQRKGLCWIHYYEDKVCSVGGCKRPVVGQIGPSKYGCNHHKGLYYRRRVPVDRLGELDSGVCCEVCGDAPATVADHNHTTGKFRGFTCHKCNAWLGVLESEWRDSGEQYLNKHK